MTAEDEEQIKRMLQGRAGARTKEKSRLELRRNAEDRASRLRLAIESLIRLNAPDLLASWSTVRRRMNERQMQVVAILAPRTRK